MLKLGSAAWANNSFGPTLMEAITAAGLTTNLQVCLDAGDPASYPGNGTKWLDTSGNGYDFFLGTDGTTSAPTFVGVGRQSYWSFNGSTFFRYDTTNEAWMQTLHKNNAVYSAVVMYYRPTAGQRHFGTSGGTTGMTYAATGNITVLNATATVLSVTGDITPANNSWFFNGVSLTEATGVGGGFLYSNGVYNQVSGSDTFDSTYTSPAAGNASFTMELSAEGNGVNKAQSGTLVSCIAIWSGTAISKANMDTLWASMRGRFRL